MHPMDMGARDKAQQPPCHVECASLLRMAEAGAEKVPCSGLLGGKLAVGGLLCRAPDASLPLPRWLPGGQLAGPKPRIILFPLLTPETSRLSVLSDIRG